MPLMAKTSGWAQVNQRRHLATDAVALRLQQIRETHVAAASMALPPCCMMRNPAAVAR
jgi:hypothetical protein